MTNKMTTEERLRNQLHAVQMTTIGMAQLLMFANERIDELETELARLKASNEEKKADGLSDGWELVQ